MKSIWSAAGQSIDSMLFALFVISAIALAFPFLAIMAGITIIGIPVMLVLFFAPAVFLVGIIARLLYLGLAFLPAWRIIPVACMTAAILIAPPMVLNKEIYSQAEAIVAGDHNDIALPLHAKTIAMRLPANYDRNPCDDFCQRVLLSGTAEKVLVVSTPYQPGEPKATEKALAFHMERLPVCPKITLKTLASPLVLEGETETDRSQSTTLNLMNLRISDGECLVQSEALLADADLVISRGNLKHLARGNDAGFDRSADTISAERTSVYIPSQGARGFTEIYRKTEVAYQPFGPVFVPAPVPRGDFKFAFGWFRVQKYINRGKDTDASAWGRFLTDTVGLPLRITSDQIRQRMFNKIEAALMADRPPTAAEWRAFSVFFDRAALDIGRPRNTEGLSKAEFALLLKALASPNFPPPPGLPSVVQYSERTEPKGTSVQLGSLMFSKALGGQTWPDNLGITQETSLNYLKYGIARLPDEAVAPHFEDLMQLSRQPLARYAADAALIRLSVFGDDAAPAMLDLVEVGLSGGRYFFRDDKYDSPYVAGLRGLCIAGARAQSAAPQLRGWLQMGKIPMHSSYGELAVKALVRMGTAPEWLWPIYSKANDNRTEANFARLVERANKGNCEY